MQYNFESSIFQHNLPLRQFSPITGVMLSTFSSRVKYGEFLNSTGKDSQLEWWLITANICLHGRRSHNHTRQVQCGCPLPLFITTSCSVWPSDWLLTYKHGKIPNIACHTIKVFYLIYLIYIIWLNRLFVHTFEFYAHTQYVWKQIFTFHLGHTCGIIEMKM